MVALFREFTGDAIPDPSWHSGNLLSEPELTLTDDEAHSGGFGDPNSNPLVEKAAVTYVTDLYLTNGWSVKSVENLKCGYDLRCTKGNAERHVEVKGCSASGKRFIVTAKEHGLAFSDPSFRVAIVSDALSDRSALEEITGKQFQTMFECRAIQYLARRVTAR